MSPFRFTRTRPVFRSCLVTGLDGEPEQLARPAASDFKGRSSATGRKTAGEAKGDRAMMGRKEPGAAPNRVARQLLRPFRDLHRCCGVAIIWVLLLGIPLSSVAQEAVPVVSVGDPAYKERIHTTTSAIYEGVERWVFGLQKAHGWDLNMAHGVEIQTGFVGEEAQRIIAKLWTDQGIYAVEFYCQAGALLHTYETFEFFEEEAPKDAWRNFKGVAAWERRTYFDGAQIGYAETKGHHGPQPGTDADRLHERLVRVLAFFARPDDHKP